MPLYLCFPLESLSNSEFYDNITEIFRPIVNEYMESKAQLTQTLLTVNLFNEQYEQEESDEREYRYENFIFIKMFHVFGIILFSHCTAQKIKFSFKEFFSKEIY